MGGIRNFVDLVARENVALRALLSGSVLQDFAVKKLTVSQTEGIVGTATNNSVQVGSVGEYVESVVGATDAPITLQYGDLTSIFLTAGDWDVSAMIVGYPNGGAATQMLGGIGTVAGNSSTGLVLGSNKMEWVPNDINIGGISCPPFRVLLGEPATIYLKMYAVYSAGAPKFRGRISARRVR